MKTLDWLQKRADEVIFYDHDQSLCFSDLTPRIVAVQKHLLSNEISTCVIYNEQVDNFLVQILACLISGVDIILPANLSEDMLKPLQEMPQLINHDIAITDDDNDPIKIINDDCQISLFTSGSTGEPKKITRQFSQLVVEVNELSLLWPLKTHLFVASVSHQHIYGLLFKLLWPFYSGSVIAIPAIKYEESLLQFDDLTWSLVFVSSPAFLKRMQVKDRHPHALKRLFCSGGLLSDERHQWLEEQLQVKAIQVYGSSETGGIAFKECYLDWRFFPSVETKLIKECLWVKSPFCYSADWQNTQDRIKKTESGMQLLGRVDKIVKLEDKRISLTQLERHLNQHQAVEEARVLVLQENKQMIAAVIRLAADYQAMLNNKRISEINLKTVLRDHLKPLVDPLAIPRKIKFIDAIPENQQGKTTPSMLRSLFYA